VWIRGVKHSLLSQCERRAKTLVEKENGIGVRTDEPVPSVALTRADASSQGGRWLPGI
jgi:hypothetical protein